MSGNDLFRQRVVLALREILVISDSGELYEHPRGLASYYDMRQELDFQAQEDTEISNPPTIEPSPSMRSWLLNSSSS